MQRLLRQGIALGLGISVALLLGSWKGGTFAQRTGGVAARVLEPSEVLVLDGDTVRVDGRDCRLLGVDTPEKSAPWFDGAQEPWASRASALVRDALDGADRITLHSRGATDTYGRDLVHLFVDGRSVSVLLVEAALAYPTVDRYGDSGFPALADRIARRARPPEFEQPWRWRRAHRVPHERE